MKNFPKEWDENKLKDLFSSFGEILNVKIEKDNKEESKGFGFVCFSDSEKAKVAIEELNGTKQGECEL